WKGLPFVILVLLAGLQAIPREIGEAARIDGANPWQEFRYVTFPSLRLIVSVVVIFRIIGTFNAFDLVWLLTGGGPGNATRVPAGRAGDPRHRAEPRALQRHARELRQRALEQAVHDLVLELERAGALDNGHRGRGRDPGRLQPGPAADPDNLDPGPLLPDGLH